MRTDAKRRDKMAALYELLSLTVTAILVTTPALAQTRPGPGSVSGTLGGSLGTNPTGGISGTFGGTPAIVVGPDGLYQSAPSPSTPLSAAPPAGTVLSSPTSNTGTPSAVIGVTPGMRGTPQPIGGGLGIGTTTTPGQ
jgi:hypothetical protein